MAAAATLLATLIAPNAANAGPVDDQRQRVEQITDQLADLERQVDVLTEDYAVATDELRQLEEDVTAAEDAVAEQQAAVTALQDELSDAAVQAFIGAGSNGLSPIFTDATGINADLKRAELSRAALSSGTADSDDLDRELNELSDAQDVLEAERDAANRRPRKSRMPRRPPSSKPPNIRQLESRPKPNSAT